MEKMKLSPKIIVLALLGCFVAISCAQDSIFYDLSIEPEPIEPLIAGSPTNMAVVKDRLYVGTRMSKTIYYYTARGWSSISSPNGSLGELASDGKNLYALVFPGGEPLKSSIIYRYDDTADPPVWTALERDTSAAGYSIQTLYAVDGGVFAGGQYLYANTDVYTVLYYDPNDSSGKLKRIKTAVPEALLRGAAKSGTKTYLATKGSGIFEFSGGDTVNETPVAGTAGKVLNGIINAGGILVAVSNDGNGYGSVFIADAENVTAFAVEQLNYNFTGGMGIWRQYVPTEGSEPPAGVWKDSLLLLGIRGSGSSLTQGYRELILDASGKPTFSMKQPGETYGTPTSALNGSKYNASIGIHPVQSILQLPTEIINHDDAIAAHGATWQPLIFAGTSRDGLWSYKGAQWNAED